jgi:cytochrome c biogenesis protein
VNLALFDQRSKEFLEGPFKVGWNEKVKVPSTDYAVRLVGFVSDFAFDRKNKVVYAKSAEHDNPAVRLEVYKNGKAMPALWVFLKHPGFIPVFGKSERYSLAMVNYQGIQYTGLQITKDPGVNIVWMGSTLMFLGFILAFFVFYKRLWVKIMGGTDGIDVNVGGLINKNKIIFEREFNTLIDSLRDELQKE